MSWHSYVTEQGLWLAEGSQMPWLWPSWLIVGAGSDIFYHTHSDDVIFVVCLNILENILYHTWHQISLFVFSINKRNCSIFLDTTTTPVNVEPISSQRRKRRMDISPTSTGVIFEIAYVEFAFEWKCRLLSEIKNR